MFETLSEGFKSAKLKLQGKAVLNEEILNPVLETVRNSLLEADVEYNVVKSFLSRVKDEALGKTVSLSAGKGLDKLKASPANHFIQICQKNLEHLMGGDEISPLKFSTNRITTIMMVGLQGSGKTTTTGKIAHWLMQNKKRKPLLIAADIYRPAAIEQLKVLGEKLNAPVYSRPGAKPLELSVEGIRKAYELGCDTVLIDTAGRLTIDEELMDELNQIKKETQPDETFLVVDSMMGQDAVTTAKAFHDKVPISGIVMTKLDGDARGGAALSIREVTHCPIRFIGLGEGLDRLEEFRPEGLASRILGMGDIVGLMQDFERVAENDAEAQAERMLRGQFNFRDFYQQIATIQKMGPMKDLISKLPMQNLIPKNANFDEKELVKIKSMIDSMTEKERIQPSLLNESRVKRIAMGSGRKTNDVQGLIQTYKGMRQMIQMASKNLGGLLGKIPGMGAINQFRNMKNMMGDLQNGGGGGLSQLSKMLGMGGGPSGGGAGAASPMRKPMDRDKQKKMRKLAKKARKKNRK